MRRRRRPGRASPSSGAFVDLQNERALEDPAQKLVVDADPFGQGAEEVKSVENVIGSEFDDAISGDRRLRPRAGRLRDLLGVRDHGLRRRVLSPAQRHPRGRGRRPGPAGQRWTGRRVDLGDRGRRDDHRHLVRAAHRRGGLHRRRPGHRHLRRPGRTPRLRDGLVRRRRGPGLARPGLPRHRIGGARRRRGKRRGRRLFRLRDPALRPQWLRQADRRRRRRRPLFRDGSRC